MGRQGSKLRAQPIIFGALARLVRVMVHPVYRNELPWDTYILFLCLYDTDFIYIYFRYPPVCFNLRALG